MGWQIFESYRAFTKPKPTVLKKLLALLALAALLSACEPDTLTPTGNGDTSKPNPEQPEGGDNPSGGDGGGQEGIPGKPEGDAPAISTWHWSSDTDRYGINFVVTDSVKAAATLDSYRQHNVRRVYGGYAHIPAHPTQRHSLKSWNRQLYASGIRSVYLIGSSRWIYPEYREDMRSYIGKYYVSFNQAALPAERLQGLHVDIEPHQLDEWALATPARKRELLLMLRDTYADIRAFLTANGMGDDEVMADIPVWFDSLTAIGWESEADRDAWFASVTSLVDGFSLMAYEVSSLPTLLSRTEWERNQLDAVVEVGLNASEVGTVWQSKSAFLSALHGIQQSTQAWVVIHSYAVFMQL